MRKKLWMGVMSAVIAAIAMCSVFFTRTADAQDLPKPVEPAKAPAPIAVPAPAPVVTIPPPAVSSLEDKPAVPSVPTPVPTPTPITNKPVEVQQPNDAAPSFPPLEQPKNPLVASPTTTVQPPVPDGGTGIPPTATKTRPLSSTPGTPPVPVSPKVEVPSPTFPQLTPPFPTPPSPSPGIIQPLAKPANSPWVLHVEVVEGKTIVTATVNKKHEFKIVCDSLDLQTGRGTLKASGKVRINGDTLQGSCNELAISLLEDRLVLDGNAEVRIQRATTTVSSEAKSATFELKGESLNLRISELQSAHVIESQWRRSDDTNPRSRVVPASLTTDSKQWSSWGTLRATAEKADGLTVYSLVGTNGSTIANLVTREGGTLHQYEGRSISVFGTTETINGRAILRVSHIALP